MGGTGSGYAKCTNAAHDLAQGGKSKTWCGLDHTHFGEPQPDTSALKTLQSQVAAMLARYTAGGAAKKKK